VEAAQKDPPIWRGWRASGTMAMPLPKGMICVLGGW
jgi:hypothetical protein